MTDQFSEQDIQNLFQQHLPPVDLPPALANAVRAQVLDEVAMTFKAESVSGEAAQIMVEGGAATILRAGAVLGDIGPGGSAELYPGDGLVTLSGNAIIDYFDGQRSYLGADSRVELLVLTRNGETTNTSLMLHFGEVRNEVSMLSPNSRFEIKTPVIVVRASAGAAFTVSVPPTEAPTEPPTVEPTATNTAIPTATDTPASTATHTSTPLPTSTPTPTDTPEPRTVRLIVPHDGVSGGATEMFQWAPDFQLGEDEAYELIFWKPGQDPLTQGFGLALPTTQTSVTVDLQALDNRLGGLLDPGEYRWGVRLVRKSNPNERLEFLDDSRLFTYTTAVTDGAAGGGSGE